MQKYAGLVANGGIAVGTIKIIRRFGGQTIEKKAVNAETELAIYKEARQRTERQLEELREEAAESVGTQAGDVFDGYKMLLNDASFNQHITELIANENVSAAYAVYSAGHKFSQIFENIDDDYMKARSMDIIGLAYRIIGNIDGNKSISLEDFEKSEIIVSEDFFPSEVVRYGKRIAALVSTRGSIYSHAAIIAKMMNIPMLVGVKINPEMLIEGIESAVDANEGIFYVEPSDELIDRLISQNKEKSADDTLRDRMRGQETVTISGHKINLLANVSSSREIDSIIDNDAEGIGLLRSELLFIDRSDYPSEDEQFETYKDILQRMNNKKVIIRTFDMGSDKIMEGADMPQEDNPAMGFRGIRISLAYPDMFKKQVRAILRASVYGDASILYPMVTSEDEVLRVKSMVAEVMADLNAEGIPYDSVHEGLMIETPAAVMISDELAKLVDFFCIGTNDLTQFTLAADRQNSELGEYFNPQNKAVKKMIQMVVDNAHKAGIRAGICGEMGYNAQLIGEYVSIGIDGFSVTPSLIPFTRNVIRELE